MYKTIFTIGEVAKAYIGYTKGQLWNGWATPYFEFAEAIEVMQDFNKCADNLMRYDETYDQFYVWDEGNDDYEMWKGEDYATDEGIKHLYGIGAYCWVWEFINDDDIHSLAQQIEEFIYYHDTYNYLDEYDLKREQTVEIIAEQFKDFKTLKQAIEIMHNEELTEELKFAKLGGILKL